MPSSDGTTTRNASPSQTNVVSWATASAWRNVLSGSIRSAMTSVPTTRMAMLARSEAPTYILPTLVWSAVASHPATRTGAPGAAAPGALDRGRASGPRLS